jgi:hypothetical protein
MSTATARDAALARADRHAVGRARRDDLQRRLLDSRGRATPALLGSNVREGWGVVADFNDNVMKVGLAGGTLNYPHQELTLHRHGRAEQDLDEPRTTRRCWTVGHARRRDGVVVETSAKVLAERRLLGERERLAALFEQRRASWPCSRGRSIASCWSTAAMCGSSAHRPLLGLTFPQALPDAESQGYVRLLSTRSTAPAPAYTDHGARYDSQVVPGGRWPSATWISCLPADPRRVGRGHRHLHRGRGNHRACPGERRREGLARFAEELHRLDDSASVGYAAAGCSARCWM